MAVVRTHHRQTRGTPIVKSARHTVGHPVRVPRARQLSGRRGPLRDDPPRPSAGSWSAAAGRRPSGPPRPRTPTRWPPCSPSASRRPTAGSAPSACCPRPGPRATSGSARTLRRAVAEAKAAWRRDRRVYRPWQAVPGEHLAIDWGGRGRAPRLLRGPRLEPGPLRAVRGRREPGDDPAPARRVLRGPRRRARRRARRPHGLPQGRRRRQRRRAGTRATSPSPPTTASGPTSARRRTPRSQGRRRAPRRVRQGRPA